MDGRTNDCDIHLYKTLYTCLAMHAEQENVQADWKLKNAVQRQQVVDASVPLAQGPYPA